MSGLVPAERVRSFLEKLIHWFGQNQWLYRFITNETFCDSLIFQTRGSLQWVLNHRPESEGHPQWSLIILFHSSFYSFMTTKKVGNIKKNRTSCNYSFLTRDPHACICCTEKHAQIFLRYGRGRSFCDLVKVSLSHKNSQINDISKIWACLSMQPFAS